MVRIQT